MMKCDMCNREIVEGEVVHRQHGTHICYDCLKIRDEKDKEDYIKDFRNKYGIKG